MREVTHHLRLGDLGQIEGRTPTELIRDQGVGVFASANVPSRTPRFVDLAEQRLERRQGGLNAGVGNYLRADRGHRAATVSRVPAVIRSTAETRASASLSLVISVHWITIPSRSSW